MTKAGLAYSIVGARSAAARSSALAAALVALLAAGCAPSSRAVDLSQAEKEIAAGLDDWHDAAARADEERYFGHFTKDAVFLGTDATERWDTAAFRAYAHPYFARGKAWSFRSVRRGIAVATGGLYAWFDEDLDTPNMGPARGSGVLVRGALGDPWRIAQYNLALTIPNERMKEVKALLANGASGPAQAAAPSPSPTAQAADRH